MFIFLPVGSDEKKPLEPMGRAYKNKITVLCLQLVSIQLLVNYTKHQEEMLHCVTSEKLAGCDKYSSYASVNLHPIYLYINIQFNTDGWINLEPAYRAIKHY